MLVETPIASAGERHVASVSVSRNPNFAWVSTALNKCEVVISSSILRWGDLHQVCVQHRSLGKVT